MRGPTLALGLLAAAALAVAAHAFDRTLDRSAAWERDPTVLLSGFTNMYNPHVVYDPEIDADHPYRMWFFGWASADMNPGYPGCDAIFHARSADLTHWEVYAGDAGWDAESRVDTWVPVLCADDKPYDQWHNGDPSVVKHDGRYVMAYSSTGFDLDGIPAGLPGDTDGDICCVMAAESDDGIHWTRAPRPILLHEPELGVLEKPEEPAYTGMFHRPSLMFDDGRWRLWFDYWVAGPRGICMGHAECDGDPLDAAAWHITHDLAEPLLLEWPNPDVIRVGDRYYAYGDPNGYPGQEGWPSRQMCEAVSDDGLSWRVLGFIAPDEDTPACHVPEAFVEPGTDPPVIRLFYACQIGGEPYNWRYDRIRAMRRTVGDD
jgi:hypothetical protein